MKKILISGYYGFDNFGDEAILDVLLSHLKGHDVTVLSANPKSTVEKHRVNSINSFNSDLIMKRLADFDILISGGGSLLQNVTSNRSLLYYCGLIYLFASMKKDVVIFAQGIGPINGFWGKLIAKMALKKCKFISVRDEKSLDLLKSWGINAKLVCDPIFDLQLPERKKTRKIGIQLRKFHTLTDKLFDEIIKQIALKFSDREIELIAFQDTEDVGISQVFLNKLKKKNPTINAKIVQNLSNQQIIERVSEYDYLIAMRFHACLLGLKYGIKTLAISYDPKVENLAKEAQIPYLQMDSDKNNYNKAFEDLDNLTAFNLINFASTKTFNWEDTGIDTLINED